MLQVTRLPFLPSDTDSSFTFGLSCSDIMVKFSIVKRKSGTGRIRESYKFREEALLTRDRREVASHNRILRLAAISWRLQTDEDPSLMMPGQMEAAFVAIVHRLVCLQYVERPHRIRRLYRVPKTFEDFSSHECWMYFRTRKADLPRLLRAMKFDLAEGDAFVADNGSKFTGPEVMMIGMTRMSQTGSIESAVGKHFELDFSALSRAGSLFVDHMMLEHRHLLLNGIPFWKPFFEEWAEAVRVKLQEKGDVCYPPGTFCISMFHDCTVIASCRPGGGPRSPGIDALRNDNFMQMAFYSGWKKHHGFKYLTCEAPNGMCIYMFGPKSFRLNDLDLMDDSDFNGVLADAQAGEEKQYKSYGDGIFAINTNTVGKFCADPTPLQQKINHMMSKLRVANEWDYGITNQLFPFVKEKLMTKIRKNRNVTRYYFVATILRNAHMCLYEGITASYFGCPCPTLEDYFSIPKE